MQPNFRHSTPEALNKNIRILVAEDDETNYKLIALLLKGNRIQRAENGKIAVELMQQNHYDMVLMDIRMPEMDGMEATREIRKFNKSTPIIAITAYATDIDMEDAIGAGCNAFLTKPVSFVNLNEIISDVILHA